MRSLAAPLAQSEAGGSVTTDAPAASSAWPPPLEAVIQETGSASGGRCIEPPGPWALTLVNSTRRPGVGRIRSLVSLAQLRRLKGQNILTQVHGSPE